MKIEFFWNYVAQANNSHREHGKSIFLTIKKEVNLESRKFVFETRSALYSKWIKKAQQAT